MVETAFFAQERWSEIDDFPGYEVSDHGRVRNVDTGTIITPTRKPTGMMMVGLMRNRVQCKKSLALLVARAFLEPYKNPVFDTPINLDGDRGNNHYSNLMWRPLWFARKYARQFLVAHAYYDGPIEDVKTNVRYKDSFSASVEHGILEHEVVLSMMNHVPTWPTGQVFREAL